MTMLLAVLMKLLVILLVAHNFHLMLLLLVLYQARLHLQWPSFDINVGLFHFKEFWNDSMLKKLKLLAIKIEKSGANDVSY